MLEHMRLDLQKTYGLWSSHGDCTRQHWSIGEATDRFAASKGFLNALYPLQSAIVCKECYLQSIDKVGHSKCMTACNTEEFIWTVLLVAFATNLPRFDEEWAV